MNLIFHKNNYLFYQLLFLSTIIILFSCNSKKDDQEDLYEEVLAIHNEVMPRMEEVSALTVKLKAKLETLNKNPGKAAEAASINQTIEDLGNASKGMMDWMRSFNPSYDTLPHSISIQYLNEEKLKIQKVKHQMNTAIEAAKEKI